MKQQTFKYPSRADMLALLRQRERQLADMPPADVGPANRVEPGSCHTIPGVPR